MWDADNQRISGAKCALDVRHASIRPTLRKALQLIELVGQQASKTPVCSLNDMLCPGGATPPSLVRMVRAGDAAESGNAIEPSE